ncbi:MAG TPA: cation:proton antiporter [Terriglobales bacterium]|nr:cation:proton antiporter [Terriglobales bacterium]
MQLVLVFSATLLIAVLISERAERSVLSTAVLFLVSGFLAGCGIFGSAPHPSREVVQRFAELALFSVLFTDGMRLNVHDLRKGWLLPTRALIRGMPLTIAGIGLLGKFLAGLSWTDAFLLGAALSPTDPVFVAAIFRFEGVPDRVKHLLNVESGVNDGLALPIVVVLLAVAGSQHESGLMIAAEMLFGIVIGIVIPWLAIKLLNSRFFAAAEHYRPLNAFAIGLLVLGISDVFNANTFLAAFAAGITIATLSDDVKESFYEFGELVTELLKLAALLFFAMLIAPRFFEPVPWRQIAFVLLAVFAVRPLIFPLALAPSDLTRREKLVAGWFGPKGFASVVYGFMILNGRFPQAPQLAHLMGIAIAASIIVYASTDVLIARWIEKHPIENRSQQNAVSEPREIPPSAGG